MARTLILPVCLGLFLFSVALAVRFPSRGSAGGRQNFLRRIFPRPDGRRGGGQSSAGRQFVLRGRNVVARPYNGPGIPTRQQIESFFQRNPSARQRAQAVQSRSFQFPRPGCGCNQVTCDAESTTMRSFVDQITGRICIFTSPMEGITATVCTEDTNGDSCPEVAQCGLGTCQDSAFMDVPFTAACIVSFNFPDIVIVDISDTFSVPNGCCCQ